MSKDFDGGAVEESRERYQNLFELSPEPYLLTDAHGTIQLSNARTAALFGRPTDEIEGASLASFIHPEDRPALADQLHIAAAGGGIHAWEVRLAEGATEPAVLATVEPSTTEAGDLELRWALWDALPLELVRTRLQRLLEDSRGDAASLRVLAEWQASLLGSAAQDMGTPLAVITSTLDSLLADGASMSTPVARAMLERASRQAMRLRRLLPTLLQLGRLQLETAGSARHHISIGTLVDEVLHDLAPLDRDVSYQFEVTDVHVDPLHLARALVELLTHVAAQGRSGSTLHIGTLARGVDVELFVDVADHRIPEHVREVILSPFLGTGRRIEEGNGDDLGLSLVAVFARMHGGRAWIQDAPDDGTSFRILLSNALPDLHEESDPATDDGTA